jgi:hypothetical protein
MENKKNWILDKAVDFKLKPAVLEMATKNASIAQVEKNRQKSRPAKSLGRRGGPILGGSLG